MEYNSGLTYDNADFWQWIADHKDEDVARLMLSAPKDATFLINSAILQIECRKKYAKKLSETLKSFPRFFFPSVLSGEQSTGDRLADFHSKLFTPDDVVVDFTAGLGIDSMHIARVVKNIVAVERNRQTADALIYNSQGLRINNMKVICGDCREIADTLNGTKAFIDPARRAADGSRVFGLHECEPDIISMLPQLKPRFGQLIVKASPMLDISQTIKDLPGASDIYIVGTPTECKELVAVVNLKNDNVSQPLIHAVTLGADGQNIFTFTRQQENDAQNERQTERQRGNRRHKRSGEFLLRKRPEVDDFSPIISAGDILYEPYPATMKAAPLKLLATAFGLSKFHSNTHLYFGPKEDLKNDFPGEKFEIIDIVPWQSKNLKRFKTKYPYVSVTTRNFGMTAQALQSKLGVKQGGGGGGGQTLRLFGIGLGNKPTDRLLIVARGL